MSDHKGKATILVVDDQRPDRELMSRALEQQGYIVLQAADYWEAVQVHQKHSPGVTLLLTAIALPGTNGYELAKTLFRIDPDLKVLFMSGQAGAEVSRFYNMPASGSHILDKPVQADDLLKRVQAAIRLGFRRQHAKGAG